MAGVTRKKPVALYVHIPFCVKKCAYCDFLSMPASEEIKERYVNILCKEIEREAVRYPQYRGTTVFFGGGTPTTLNPEQLKRILCQLKERFSVDMAGEGWKNCPEKGTEAAEITLECNPGTVTEEDLRKLRDAGFNRLSIGLQSAQNEELRKLGRIHSFEDFLKTYDLARKAGFGNINVDIMSALPGQSVESYVNTLEKVTSLRPEHISAYSLMIEEGTPFYERYGEADRQRKRDGEDERHLLPSEEEERQMYELTERILAKKGYYRYEISNYALPGRECRHNITYWKRGSYLGLGLGAASLMENCRFVNAGELREYERLFSEEDCEDMKPLSERKQIPGQRDFHLAVQQLSVQEQMEEFLFLGLRLTEGVSCKKFREYFHISIEEIYGDILKKLEKQGFLIRTESRVFLTKKGIDVSNVILAEFLL